MRLILTCIVFSLILNSISSVILHNEVVIETETRDEGGGGESGSSVVEPPSPATDTTVLDSNQKVASSDESATSRLVSGAKSSDHGEEGQVAAGTAATVDFVLVETAGGTSTIEPPPVPAHQQSTAAADEQQVVNETVATASAAASEIVSAKEKKVAAELAKPQAEEMQSFEEWKEMRLKMAAAEAAAESAAASAMVVDHNKPLVVTVSQQSPTVVGGHRKNGGDDDDDMMYSGEVGTVVQQRRKNYASAECGAKIIASNPEANKPSNILSENKDDYMLNSCSNRIWFVIELCEAVRITEIELANFELFSNVPRQFRVYASERYVASSPSTNWPSKYLLGQFEAANVRSVQTFAPKDGGVLRTSDSSSTSNDTNATSLTSSQTYVIYSKYVRFEMLSHYGNEHYCPLSLVRIFGASLSDEEDADVAAASTAAAAASEHVIVSPQALQQQQQQQTTTSSTKKGDDDNLETTTSGTTNKRADFLNRLVSERAKFFDASSQFLSNIISTFIGENFNLAKLFTLFSFKTDKKENHESENKSTESTTTETQSQPRPTSLDQVGDNQDRNEALQIDLHKVLCFSSPRSSSSSSSANSGNKLDDCCQCVPEDCVRTKNQQQALTPPHHSHSHSHPSSNNWLSKYCGYYFLMITSAQARLNTSLLFKFLNNIKYSNGEAAANFTRFSLNNVNYYILSEWLDNQTAANFYYRSSATMAAINAQKQQDTEANNFIRQQNESTIINNDKPLNNLPSSDTNTSINSSNFTRAQYNSTEATPSKDDVKANGLNSDKAEKLVDNLETTTKQTLNSVVDVQSVVFDGGEVETTTTTTATNVESSTWTSSIETTSSYVLGDSVETSTITTISSPSSSSQSAAESNTNNQETSTSTSSTTTTTTTSSPQIPTIVTPVIIGNGKDAVLMRLSNRVKILELNMTLSSQYLEKLSQHYKKQMDEMQRAFNATTSALLETIRIADERDLKQNERIVSIERRVEKMQNSMDELESLLDDLKFQTNVIIWTIIIILNVVIVTEIARWIRNSLRTRAATTKTFRTLSLPLSNAEIELLLDERLKQIRESLRNELIDGLMTATTTIAAHKPVHHHQKTIATTTSTTSNLVETLTSSCTVHSPPPSPLPSSSAELNTNASNIPQAAAAAAVVSSTLATVVALAAAASAQCTSLGAGPSSATTASVRAEEKT